MDYPVWISSLAGAKLIAIVAVFHVLISHFAVGMGLFVVLGETLAIKKNDKPLLEFIKRCSGLILLVSAVLGAVTGVGIWFSIALVSPVGTASLIHIFVWGWAIEWIFFVLEIVSIIAYYYTWGKISDKNHVFIGWLYFIGAYASLFIINGIISFQLTPGRWLDSKNFWAGFFNPTFFPSLVGRTGIIFILAAVFATLIISFLKSSSDKIIAGRYSGKFLLVGAILSFLGMYWWSQSIPLEVREVMFGGNLILSNFFKYSALTTLVLVIIAGVFLFGVPSWMNIGVSIILLIISQISFAYYEFSRERVRKPFVVRDQIYSNGIMVNEAESLNSAGILSKAKWEKLKYDKKIISKGEAVYNAQCLICHQPVGFNEMKSKVEGLTADDLIGILDDLGSHPLMPPFFGNEDEKIELAKYLEKIGKGGR